MSFLHYVLRSWGLSIFVGNSISQDIWGQYTRFVTENEYNVLRCPFHLTPYLLSQTLSVIFPRTVLVTANALAPVPKLIRE